MIPMSWAESSCLCSITNRYPKEGKFAWEGLFKNMPPSRPVTMSVKMLGEVLLAERRPSPVLLSALTTPLFSPAWEPYSCGSGQLCFASFAWEGDLKNIRSACPPPHRVCDNIPQLKDVMTCKHPSQDRAIHGQAETEPCHNGRGGVVGHHTLEGDVFKVISRLVTPPHIYESARVFKNCPMVVLFPHGPHRLLDHEQCLQDCLPSRQDLLCPTHHPSHQVPQASIQPSCPVVQRLLQEVEVCPTVAVLLLLDKERDLLAGRTQVNQYPCFYQPVLGTR